MMKTQYYSRVDTAFQCCRVVHMHDIVNYIIPGEVVCQGRSDQSLAFTVSDVDHALSFSIIVLVLLLANSY